jgi:serine/threonine-protein kinase
MTEDARLRTLLEDLLNGGGTPEEVCRSCPELLAKVRAGWQRLRALEAELGQLFPDAAAPPAVPNEGVPSATAALPDVRGYAVEGLLGHGGMGVVYKARHLRLNRPVALKMLLAGIHARPQELERFLREAEAAAGLRHPNIVQVHDVGDVDGRPYFTMEFVAGGSLTQRLAGTPLPPRRAAALLVTVAEAIHVAHQHGIVHRDLKPSNILLTPDGTPKITDFGLARRLEGGDGLTLSGAVVGTPGYMAPEQARGDTRAVGPAADVYALGTILYECLTGRPPFKAATAAETVQQVISQDPVPPSRLNLKLPRDLETICLKCLQKDPGRRYPTAADVAAEVERFLKHEPIQARPPGRWERCLRWVRRRPAAAALLAAVGLLLAAGAVSAWSLYQQQSAARARRAQTDQEVRAILERARGPLEEGWQAVDLAKLAEAESEANRAAAIARSGGASAAVRQQAEAFQLDAVGRLGRAKKSRALLDAVLDVSASAEPSSYANEELNRILALAGPNADAQYVAAFRLWGLDVDATPEADAVARLRQEPDAVLQEVIAALDAWMLERRALGRPEAEWRRLFRLADQLDRGARSRQLRARLAETASRRDTKATALRELRQDIDPRTAPALTVVLLSRVYAAARDGAAAEEVLRLAVTARPDQAVLLNELANLLCRPPRPRLEEAIGYYRAARGQRPGLGLRLSWTLDRAGRPIQAEEVLRELALRQPDNLAVHFYLGFNLVIQEKYAAGAAAFRKVLDLKPDFAEAHGNLGCALYKLHKYDEAVAALRQALALDPTLPLAHMNLGVALHYQGKHDEAEAALRRAIDLQPDFAEALVNLGSLLRQRGQGEEGEAALRKAIDLKPELAAVQNSFGVLMFEQGKYAEAEAAFRKAAASRPAFAQAYFNLGNALREQRKFADAETAYRTALAYRPGYAGAYSNLGQVLTVQGKHADAEAAYRQALDLQPELVEASFNLAVTLMERAQFTEAAALLKKCIELLPPGTPRHGAAQKRLQLCERFAALDARLPAILSGEEKPADAAERAGFARLCLLKRQATAAARLYAVAFTTQPQLAADPRTGHRLLAACAAALVGCGRAEDGADLSDAERARWRKQALEWLRAELAAMVRLLDANPAGQRETIRGLLTFWRGHADLACVRDAVELARLPAEERKEFAAFWAEVAAALARTGK